MKDFSELSFESVPLLWKDREEIFKANKVDLKECKIDSAGMAFLVQWAKSLPSHQLAICNAPKNALDLISTYKLSELFNIEP